MSQEDDGKLRDGSKDDVDVEQFPTGDYAIPSQLRDRGAEKTMRKPTEVDARVEINKALTMGRLAFYSGHIAEARNFCLKAVNLGSEEGRFLLGWVNVTDIVAVKGKSMSENARKLMFENLKLMIAAIWESENPRLVFEFVETLRSVSLMSGWESAVLEDETLTWNMMFELMQRCMEDASPDTFGTLLAFLNKYIDTNEFAEFETRWNSR